MTKPKQLWIDGEIRNIWRHSKLPRLRNYQTIQEFRTHCIIIRFRRLKNLEAVADTLNMHINTVRKQLRRNDIGGTMNNNRGAHVNYLPGDTTSIRDMEKYLILTRLIHMKGNKTKTAQSLGIGLRTLQRKLNAYGVKHSLNARVSLADIQPDTVMMAEEAISQFKGAK